MKIQIAFNTLVFVILIQSCKNSKELKNKTNNTMSERRKEVKTSKGALYLFNNKSKEFPYNNTNLNYLKLNYSKYDKNGIHKAPEDKITLKIHNKRLNKSKPMTFGKTKCSSSKIKHNTTTTKLKVTKNGTKSPRTQKRKKKAKVFQDTREDIMHYKLIDNMMFKPLNSNNSASIIFSDESEITQADVDKAIEGRDGSCIAIPVKRKKDIYKEFLRWAHKQEKSERRAKIEKEVIEKYRNNTMHLHLKNNINNKHQINTTTANHKTLGTYNKSYQSVHFFQGKNKSTSIKTNQNSIQLTNTSGNINQNIHTTNLKNIKVKIGTEGFKAESVELQYDPDFLNKLHNSVKEHKEKDFKRRKRKKKTKKPKQRQTYEGNPADISADDYSAQEMFIMNTQKEAMGRRYYQMFVNKTASDFWDNNTLETTKMLEFLIPLGEHLHKTLEEPPPNEGTNFCNDLQMYKNELERFIGLVKKDKAETRPDVVALLEEPYEHVSETKYSEDEIKIMFGWESDEYEQFEKLLEETREMWFDLQLFHHCYQFVSESAESYYSDHYNYTKDEQDEIIKNNTWLPS